MLAALQDERGHRAAPVTNRLRRHFGAMGARSGFACFVSFLQKAAFAPSGLITGRRFAP
jgi:hypothetical protein